MIRAIWPALKQPGDHKHLLALFLIASAAIALFYGAGIMWNRQTPRGRAGLRGLGA